MNLTVMLTDEQLEVLEQLRVQTGAPSCSATLRDAMAAYRIIVREAGDDGAFGDMSLREFSSRVVNRAQKQHKERNEH